MVTDAIGPDPPVNVRLVALVDRVLLPLPVLIETGAPMAVVTYYESLPDCPKSSTAVSEAIGISEPRADPLRTTWSGGAVWEIVRVSAPVVPVIRRTPPELAGVWMATVAGVLVRTSEFEPAGSPLSVTVNVNEVLKLPEPRRERVGQDGRVAHKCLADGHRRATRIDECSACRERSYRIDERRCGGLDVGSLERDGGLPVIRKCDGLRSGHGLMVRGFDRKSGAGLDQHTADRRRQIVNSRDGAGCEKCGVGSVTVVQGGPKVSVASGCRQRRRPRLSGLRSSPGFQTCHGQ